jgi:DNA-binding MarR family transcriptional regulator
MNAIFFGLKKAFHGTLRVARPMLHRLGLTAARFDMLYALRGHDWKSRSVMHQARLGRVLGVSRPTVSRMLRSLEQLGLVLRTRSGRDRRQLEVRLTPEGRALIRKAHSALVRRGWAQLAVDSALGGSTSTPFGSWHDDTYCLYEMAKLDDLLGRIRRAFGDVATLDYPWSPDD